MENKTRILVTHHLEVAERADMILVMDQGRIIQQGTHDVLKNIEGTFQTLLQEHGHTGRSEIDDPIILREVKDASIGQNFECSTLENRSNPTDRAVAKIHLDEELNTGAVSGKTFIAYFKALHKGGPFVVSIVGAVLAECAVIALSFVLSFWATSSIPGFSRGNYMSLYAGLGFAVAIFAFIGWYSIFLSGIGASFLIAQKALNAVLRSPVKFHDRTPSGRIISRLTKDVQLVDEFMARHYHWVFLYILSIVGSISLVFYAFPYLAILFIPIVSSYCLLGVFYGRTARQTRRISSTMRSFVYSAFGEQLSGLLTIRAFQRQQAFNDLFGAAIDNEARFYYTTTFANIWISLRLDLLASTLILGIGLFGVGFRDDVSPAKLSVVLTYSLQTTQASLHTAV
ncbi:hypothetical protein QFC20_002841 [Naganishia adeliensis]|uniref:Uncharacterized protein n=1 Tax=Naganishia adeliensis TaxID=92952 RepID=A0ACC2WG97_9TREE|nr:hypothetical protein QFC20_002841 [Naganishia adeliensis]